VGDFNADGRADIVWQDTGGQVALWLMSGATVLTAHHVATVAGWTPVLAQDFDRDAHADILWRHTSGDAALWLMNGPTIGTMGLFTAILPSWVPR
jgi:hypothetical protein